MSGARQRGLVRLAVLVGSLAGLLYLIHGVGGGSTPTSETGLVRGSAGAATGPPPKRLIARTLPERLPTSLHGDAVAPVPDGLLVIGGADRSDTSLAGVSHLDSQTGRVSPGGSLSAPLHDLGAATLGGKTYAFGGGASTTVDTVQSLRLGGTAQPVGHLPAPLSDLSATSVAGGIYLLGGYDGQSPSASVFQTVDGRSFTRVARLPTPIRYTAVATSGDKIYAFGGELANGQDTSDIQEYDIGTERAVVAGQLPQPLSHAAAVTLNGTIFLLGGRRGGTGSNQILRFDPDHNTVVPAGHLPSPVFDGAAGVAGGAGYLMGGVGPGGTSVDSIVALHPGSTR
jgi:Kelch motif protein